MKMLILFVIVLFITRDERLKRFKLKTIPMSIEHQFQRIRGDKD